MTCKDVSCGGDEGQGSRRLVTRDEDSGGCCGHMNTVMKTLVVAVVT